MITYHPPGTSPGTLSARSIAELKPAQTSVISYNEAVFREQSNAAISECSSARAPGVIAWIHIQGHPTVDQLEALKDEFELHALAVEDISHGDGRPKVEMYEEQCFIVLHLANATTPDESQLVNLFIGAGYVISIASGEINPFERMLKRMRMAQGRIRKSKEDYLLYALIDSVIDHGFPTLEHIGDRLELLETELIEDPDHEILSQIHQLRRDLLLLRRHLWPQREVINTIIQDDNQFVGDEAKLYLRDCRDHCIQIVELLETYRDMTSNLLEIHLATGSHRLNQTMRFLTAIATIFIPLTFVVGVYGMNFNQTDNPSTWAMPELNWAYSYPVLWIVMLGIAGGMFAYFKYRRWF